MKTNGTHWKDDSEAPLSLYFGFLTKKYLGAMISALSHVGLDRYFVVLSVIEQSGETFTQQNLADYFKMDKTSVVRVVNYLTGKGFVSRKVNGKDRREYFLVLTEKGRNLVPEIRQSIRKLNQTALQHLSPEQTKQFFSTLDLICQNLSKTPADEVFLNFHRVSPKKPLTRKLPDSPE